MTDIIFGIDPDADKSGVARLDVRTGQISVSTLSFPLLLDYLRGECMKSGENGLKRLVLVEAGWLNKTNWHIMAKDNPFVVAKKGNSVGRNHETGRKIVECLEYYGVPCKLVKPLPLRVRKMNLWKGRDGKITHDEIASFIGGFPKRSNQEERDAALIAWTYAGFPVARRR